MNDSRNNNSGSCSGGSVAAAVVNVVQTKNIFKRSNNIFIIIINDIFKN